MKTQHGSVPDLRSQNDAWPRETARPITEELEAGDSSEYTFDFDDDLGRPEFISKEIPTAEIDISRDQQQTAISPIPAQLAESMLAEVAASERTDVDAASSGRDPAAPQAERNESTRRVGTSDRQAVRPDPAAAVAAFRQRAAVRIDEARSALEAGDVLEALVAADAAMVEAERAPAPGIVEVIEPARPLLARVFAAYVGPPGGVPVVAPRGHEIARTQLGAAERAVLSRIDGVRTMEELFDGSGLGSIDALRIAARLMRSGAIRVV